METWEVLAREEIRHLVECYARFADSGRFSEFAELFTPEGTLEVEGVGTFRGPAEIQRFLEETARNLAHEGASRLRHHVSSVHIQLEGPDQAAGTAYFLVVGGSGPDHWGRYRDRYVKVAGRWRFERRHVRVEGRARSRAGGRRST